MRPDPARDFVRDEPLHDHALTVPRPSDALRLLWRVLRLRCPRCGGGPVRRHWLRMRDRCGACDGMLARGEADHFLGAMLLNLVVGELLFAAVLVAILVATWPLPPWSALERWAPIGALAAPVVLFPFTKLLWLGVDLLVRPDTPQRAR